MGYYSIFYSIYYYYLSIYLSILHLYTIQNYPLVFSAISASALLSSLALLFYLPVLPCISLARYYQAKIFIYLHRLLLT
jgi:hypothetical protein